MSMGAMNNATAVKEVIKHMKTSCNDPNILTIDRNLKDLEDNFNNLNFINFNEKLEQIENSNYTRFYKARIQDLSILKSQNFWAVKQKIEIIENAVAENNRDP